MQNECVCIRYKNKQKMKLSQQHTYLWVTVVEGRKLNQYSD